MVYEHRPRQPGSGKQPGRTVEWITSAGYAGLSVTRFQRRPPADRCRAAIYDRIRLHHLAAADHHRRFRTNPKSSQGLLQHRASRYGFGFQPVLLWLASCHSKRFNAINLVRPSFSAFLRSARIPHNELLLQHHPDPATTSRKSDPALQRSELFLEHCWSYR